MATTRSAGIRGLTAITLRGGGEPAALVRAVGLNPAVLDHDDIPVADHRLARLLDHAARELDLPDLGLRMAAEHDLGMLGPVAALLANSPTGADALRSAVRYLAVHADALHLTAGPDPLGQPGAASVGLSWNTGGPPLVHLMDAGLGFLHRAMCLLLGNGYGLLGVHLGYRPFAPLASYERFFGVPVTAEAGTCTLRVRDEVFRMPIAGADADLHRRAEASLTLLSPSDADVLGRVRGLLRSGPVSLAAVAGSMAMHPRTLQRRLDGHGIGFAALVDGIRRDEARRLLAETTIPIHDVSARVGFAEQATLTRACHRWWGASPRSIRGEVVVTGQDRTVVPLPH
jgi:AraC-like DNA-binding protein